MAEFTHLHGHSFHSNALQPDALSSPKDIVKRAKELGMTQIALTDHGSISGIPDFVKATAKEGIKPIVGSELYVCSDPAWRPARKGEETAEKSEEGRRSDYSHCVALCHNWEGFQELCTLLSRANSDPNFYYRPRNSFDDIKATKHITFTTACAGGILKRPDHEAVLVDLLAALGPDRLHLEIQPHMDDGQDVVNRRAVEMQQKLGLKLVAAQDYHYARPGDHETHEVLLAIGAKKSWGDPDRWKYPVDDLFIKTKAEMVKAFLPHVQAGNLTLAHVAEAINNAEAIGDRMNFEWHDLPVSLPDMGADPLGQLARMCLDAARARGLDTKREYVERLVYEMGVIRDCGFVAYFLVLAEIIAWCRKNGIMVGPGRGSSGGSLVCWLIGITQIDPLRHGLLFERFYRPGRIDLPDIDSDFDQKRRDEVIAYIRNRWGDAYVANVASYTMLKPKGAITDVARVFDVDHFEVKAATTQVDDGQDGEDTEWMWEEPSIAKLMSKYPTVERHARKLDGVMRGTGQHAAGIVISGVPIAERAAVSRRDGRAVVCWDKHTIESLGLMKLDVLGLRTMSILREAAENVWKTRAVKIDYENIPLDDARALDVFQRGDTTAVFQFEGRGMRQTLKNLKVDRFSVIADANALYRPGPMEKIPEYTQVQTGSCPAHYAHPILKPILEETSGIIVYQEQMMRIFVDMGGFSYADADKMRKIVGKKLGPDEFKKHTDDFVNGAIAKGVPAADAAKVFADMVAFAGYAFNKSHAVAYSIIAFWCAYMKARYPAEFWAAHLSNTDTEEKLKVAVDDVIKSGINIVMPNLNLSEAVRFVPVTETQIMAPLSAIKQVGERAASLIVGARKGELCANGLAPGEQRQEAKKLVGHDPATMKAAGFTDQADFEARVYRRIVNKGVIERLQRVGAMPWHPILPEVLAENRKELLPDLYREIITVSSSDHSEIDVAVEGQLKGIAIDIADMAKRVHAKCGVLPAYGKNPRVMLVFEKPGWPDEKKGAMGNGDTFDVVYQMLRKEFGYTHKDLYVTSFYRFTEPPLGFGPVDEECGKLLNKEIGIVKPPVILAFGKRPMQFFGGNDVKVMASHARTVQYGKIPVILAMNPYFAIKDPAQMVEFRKVCDALQELYV